MRRTFSALALVGSICVAAAVDPTGITLREAHEAALKNHPQISVADLRVLAARQVVREANAAYYPNLSGNVVAVGTADDNTRLSALGGLNNPSIFQRNAEGIVLSQIITDFGRTMNMVRGARFRAEAEANNAQATREQILLAVDGAYFAALEAQAVAKVAEQTVVTRQTFLDQVNALATNQLRSALDVSFARVNLEEAKLLRSKSNSDLQAAFTKLSNLMGQRDASAYQLAEEPLPPLLPTNAAPYVELALSTRPDLLRSRNEREAARKFAKAEKAARYPTISAVASAGVSPIHDSALDDAYAAAGITLNIPIFAGGLYSARQQEAALRAQAAEAAVTDEENNVIRDVRVAFLSAQNAYDRLQITRQLVEHASRLFDLAQARFQNESSSIVELDQAQLNKISAEIGYANTRYEYLLQRSALNYQTGTLH